MKPKTNASKNAARQCAPASSSLATHAWYVNNAHSTWDAIYNILRANINSYELRVFLCVGLYFLLLL
jgi:hypothetical protein